MIIISTNTMDWQSMMSACLLQCRRLVTQLEWLQRGCETHETDLCVGCLRQALIRIMSSLPEAPSSPFKFHLQAHEKCGFSDGTAVVIAAATRKDAETTTDESVDYNPVSIQTSTVPPVNTSSSSNPRSDSRDSGLHLVTTAPTSGTSSSSLATIRLPVEVSTESLPSDLATEDPRENSSSQIHAKLAFAVATGEVDASVKTTSVNLSSSSATGCVRPRVSPESAPSPGSTPDNATELNGEGDVFSAFPDKGSLGDRDSILFAPAACQVRIRCKPYGWGTTVWPCSQL